LLYTPPKINFKKEKKRKKSTAQIGPRLGSGLHAVGSTHTGPDLPPPEPPTLGSDPSMWGQSTMVEPPRHQVRYTGAISTMVEPTAIRSTMVEPATIRFEAVEFGEGCFQVPQWWFLNGL